MYGGWAHPHWSQYVSQAASNYHQARAMYILCGHKPLSSTGVGTSNIITLTVQCGSNERIPFIGGGAAIAIPGKIVTFRFRSDYEDTDFHLNGKIIARTGRGNLYWNGYYDANGNKHNFNKEELTYLPLTISKETDED